MWKIEPSLDSHGPFLLDLETSELLQLGHSICSDLERMNFMAFTLIRIRNKNKAG
jgi:hypothetical protein